MKLQEWAAAPPWAALCPAAATVLPGAGPASPTTGMYSKLIVLYTDRKENKIFLSNKEIQNGAVAKSHMTNGLLIYD